MFRRLLRHFSRGLVDNDLISRGADLHGPIAGIISALLMVSAAVTLMFLGKYNSVAFDQRKGYIPAHSQTLAEKLAMALDDRALLIGGAMLVMGLLVVVWWDSLVLDDRDVAVLAPLPVRPSTILAAKAAATSGAAVVAALALNLLPALLFPIVVLLKTSAGPLEVLQGTAAHAIAGTAGCLFVFLTFSCVRTIAAFAKPGSVIARFLPAAQFAFILLVLATLFALPELASQTRAAVGSSSGRVLNLPWTWFLGLEETLSGRSTGVLSVLSRKSLMALAGVGAIAFALQLMTLRLRFHRAGAPAVSPRSPLSRVIGRTTARLGASLMRDGRSRAAFFFSTRTITRCPRHRLYLAASLGTGLAVACATIAAAYGTGRETTLKSIGLAGQLNLIFFAVIGLRMAAAVPADIDAGWIFRFHAAPARERYVAGTRAAIFFAVVLPILIVLAPVHAWLWGGYTAMVHFAFGVIAAFGLLEVVFTDYRRMPFASSFVSASTPPAAYISLYAVNYGFFAYLTPQIEQLLIERTGLLFAWIALLGVAISRLMSSQSKRLERDQLPEFEHAEVDVQELKLWEADPRHGEDRSAAAFDARPRDLFVTFVSPRDSAPEPAAPRERRRLPLRTIRWPSVTTEITYAVRRVLARPAFTIFPVATLAIGISATTAMYSVLYSTILKPLAVHDLDTLVNVYHSDPTRGSRPFHAMSLPDYLDFARDQRVFSSTAAHAPFGQVVIAGGAGFPAVGEAVSGRYFEVLRVQPLLGRLLQPADDLPSAPRVAVVGERTWRVRFNSAPDLVGRTAVIAGQTYEIVGVAPAGFDGVELPNLAPTAIWVPLAAGTDVGVGRPAADRDYRWLGVKGRLAPGRTLAEARADVALAGLRLDRTDPIGRDLEWQFRSPPYVSRPWIALPAADRLVTEEADPSMRRLAALTMIATALVLLVACTNLSNLALARAVSRRRDVAIRYALGASRWDVIREQMLEHAIVAALAAMAAFVMLRVLVVYDAGVTLRMGPWVSIDARPVLDLRTLVAGAVATGLALIVAGLLPAWALSRGVSLVEAAASSERWSGRRLLIAAQVAVSVALVAIAGLCGRHIVRSATLDTGVGLDRLAFARFDFRVQGWPQARTERTLTALLDRASTLAGVESAAIVSGLPLKAPSSLSASVTSAERPFTSANDPGTMVVYVAGTPSLFRTLSVSIVSGRGLNDADSSATERVVVLSEYAARRIFGSTAAVGRRLLYEVRAREDRPAAVVTLNVVGVAGDTRDESGHPIAAAYVPLAQDYQASVRLIARTAGDPASAAAAIKTMVRRLDPELGVIDAGVGAQLAGTDAMAFQIMGALAGTLGTTAMVLAMIGLYSVLSFVIAQRTREIGIRVALGATSARITRLVLGEGVRPVIEGLVVGFVIADLAEMVMRPALRKPLPAIDGTMLMLVPVPFLIAAVVACYLPSRRAASVDPSIALRRE